ncbi:hypothetical protein [Anaerotruncus rubiinfantis]|uniref:hypothetical protein n=1 Tax=Anaerotruncus rubiinfantis TaxID=1720200 RepID=UPI003D7A07FB
MKQQLDLKFFIKNLQELPEAEYLASPDDLRYLMDALVNPMRSDHDVELTDLDFDQFDYEDLDLLERHLRQMEDRIGKMYNMNDLLKSIHPACSLGAAFC